MYRFCLPALALGGALFSIQSAAGRCYSIWKYPTPQHCSGVYARRTAPNDASYYVEITKPPPLITLPEVDPPTPVPLAPRVEGQPKFTNRLAVGIQGEADARSPEEIKEFDEHTAAVNAHKDEINGLMDALKRKEGNE